MAESFPHNETNPRLTENICDEPEASLMPLEDYQHSDLVPLETATESIKTLFRNLPRDVWIAKNASKKPADTLTSDESAAIHLYTMELKDQPLYSLLNKLLRHRDRRKLKPWFSYLKLFLTALFKLPPCSAKIIWRGVKADLHSKYHRGEHYTWWAFSSCTLSLEVLEQPMYLGTTGERTLFSIECLNGKNIKPHSYYNIEDEILLLPGFYFEVVSKVAGGNGLHIIHLREVVPPFILLEPPFAIQQSSITFSITPSIDSILDKVYEMNKDNDDICKLFVVLPNPLSEWKSANLFDNHYVLHFICECSINEMHFACHPAYNAPNPRVFFQIFGHYMKQFMISLAQHLFDHQTIDKYHDTRFWNVYKNSLEKIVQVLDVTEHELATTKKASDTSELKDLITSYWLEGYSLYRSITPELSIRWVCMNHYPIDQINLIHELNDIKNVILNINQSSLRFTGEIDSAKTSRICDVFARGFRLYRIDLGISTISVSCLKQLTRTLSRAPLMAIDYHYFYFCFAMFGGYDDSDRQKLESERFFNACNEIIASNPGLKHVKISSHGKYSQNDKMIGALKSNQSLRSFSYGVEMTSKDVTQLMSLLEKSQIFTTLKLTHCALPSESVETIAVLIRSSHTLINLTLSSTNIMNEGMQIIVNAICINPIMKKLEIPYNKLSDESVPLITQLLKSCSSLTSLDVHMNNITVIGARLIFEALETNRTLLHFNIAYNNLSVDHARKTTKYNGSIIGVGDLIARMLLKNITLCTLDIARIKVSDSELGPLGGALMKNLTLFHIKLGEDKFSSLSCKQITNALYWNCSLIGLDLSYNALDEVEVQKLSEILQKNDRLRYLNLLYCEIGNNGISIIAKSLKYNRTLTHLKLRDNKLTNVCAEVLADMLRINKKITCLDIGSNNIGDDGVKAIAHALFDNHTLTYIDVTQNKITDIGGQAMAHTLESNDTLFYLHIVFGNELSASILTRLRSIRRNLSITHT